MSDNTGRNVAKRFSVRDKAQVQIGDRNITYNYPGNRGSSIGHSSGLVTNNFYNGFVPFSDPSPSGSRQSLELAGHTTVNPIIQPYRPRSRDEFEIAIICARQSEFDAVEGVFDDFWEGDETYGKAVGDPNAYTTGRIGRHNVVLGFMPGMGKGAAASVAAAFRASFIGIRLGLVVGICGGAPHGTDDKAEILLGDVAISTGVIQFDFGRQFDNKMVRKDTLQDNLGRPNVELRAFLAKMTGLRGRGQLRENTIIHLAELCKKEGFEMFRYPGMGEDKLFKPAYRHKHQDQNICAICAKCASKDDDVCDVALESSCTQLGCRDENLVSRDRSRKGATDKEEHKPLIHFGLIASGDVVMKSGYHRDEIAAKEKVIAFEMEGAGVWDSFPTIVIKGVCDYADSHKNKKWQKYAAATAAACMKAFLMSWRPTDRQAG